MLSRAAERVYWAARYLERAENTARIVQQYSQLMLDLPDEVGVVWPDIVAVFGARQSFDTAGARADETAVLSSLLADPNSANSLAFSLRMARENIRNLRDILPLECWESVNELYQASRTELADAPAGEDRFDVLSEIIGRCQQINGILVGTMSHTSPYQFLVVGQNLERADMTSRIIDVAAAYLQANERLVLRYGSTLWTNVLKSVSGFQMYRQHRQPEVIGLAVIDFLVNDADFPRAVRACVDTAHAAGARLPRSEQVLEALAGVAGALPSPLPDDLDGAGVSAHMDDLQKRLGRVHGAVAETWFLPGDWP